MAVTIRGEVITGKKLELTHQPSGVKFLTDATRDDQGEGSSFSPTDLVGAALGSCIVTTMTIIAGRIGVPLQGTHFTVVKLMEEEPRQIESLAVEIHLPAALDEASRQRLERAVETCPVHRALNSSVDMPTTIFYDA